MIVVLVARARFALAQKQMTAPVVKELFVLAVKQLAVPVVQEWLQPTEPAADLDSSRR